MRLTRQMAAGFLWLALLVWPAATQDAAVAAGQAVDAPADSVMTRDGMRAIADLTRDDVGKFSREDLINLPFETLVMLSERLEVSIDELLKVKTTVASKSAATIREQPGIITVLSGDDIRRSGARDLMDVLRLVPGIYFAMDVEGVIGIGMRGNWGHEGKVLLLIDGQVMNEKRYTGVTWDHHFPVDNIKRVEVIRGPGSAMYGGYAELGVINVVTKAGDDIDGVEMSGLLGVLGKGDWTGLTSTVAHKDVSFSAGKRVKDFDFSLSGYYGAGYRSDEDYVTLYPQKDDSGRVVVNPDGTAPPITYELRNEEERGITRSALVNAGLRYKDLSARFMFDYSDAWALTSEPYLNAFYYTMAELKYDLRLLGGRLAVTPKYNLSWELPWYTPRWFGNLRVVRNNFNLTAVWSVNNYLSLTGGADGYVDYVAFLDEEWDPAEGEPESEDDTLLFTGERSAALYNAAFFAEGLIRIPRIGMSVTAGGRYEYNDNYGHAFAPRFAVTQVLRDFHWKFLYNRGFRPPSIANIEESYADDETIEPEKTDVFELELGYRITKYLFVTANAFEITINHPIVYWETDTTGGYFNGNRLGSRGVELEAALRYSRLNASLGYSYYTAGGKPRSEEDMLYVVDKEGVANAYYAAPQHKATATFGANPWKGLHVSANLLFLGPAYGNDGLDTVHVLDTAGNAVVDVATGTVKVDPAFILNLYVSYENLLIKGLTLGIGFYDLLDRSYPYVQAYNGWASPYPSYGREVAVRLTYALRGRR